jgi:hypothetical protein
MKSFFSCVLKATLPLLIAFGAGAGCETADSGAQSSSNVYYGAGFSESWYYGGYDDDVDIIVRPPGRPDLGPRPEQPIARPPAPEPRPMTQPSIPSMPRASFRR